MSTMSNSSRSAATKQPLIRASASLIIAAPTPSDEAKEGCNYRVLMMKRNTKSSFINAHVYPGGIVDKADHFAHWVKDSNSLSEKEGLLLTNKICAIRETFEESGLLLSQPSASTLKSLDANVWRHKVHNDASQFKVMCDTFGIRPAVDQLIPFSNWITPSVEKKRYNTLFFLTVLDEYRTKREQDVHLNTVSADGTETVLFDWFKPEEALEKQQLKQILMIPPQWYSLMLMSKIPDYRRLKAEAGLEAFRTKDNELIQILPQAQPTEPESAEAKEGYTMYLCYPGDEKYRSNYYKATEGNRHRLYFKGRMEDFRMQRNVDVSNIIIHSSNL